MVLVLCGACGVFVQASSAYSFLEITETASRMEDFAGVSLTDMDHDEQEELIIRTVLPENGYEYLLYDYREEEEQAVLTGRFYSGLEPAWELYYDTGKKELVQFMEDEKGSYLSWFTADGGDVYVSGYLSLVKEAGSQEMVLKNTVCNPDGSIVKEEELAKAEKAQEMWNQAVEETDLLSFGSQMLQAEEKCE